MEPLTCSCGQPFCQADVQHREDRPYDWQPPRVYLVLVCPKCGLVAQKSVRACDGREELLRSEGEE